MPGCARISGSLHMTIQMDLLCCSCKIFSTQYPTVDVITHDEYAAVFSRKGESLKKYRERILNVWIYPEDNGKGHRYDLIVDDGGAMTILVHEGRKKEDFSLKDFTIPDPRSTDNVEFNIVQTTIKCQLEGEETDKWNIIFNTCMEFSEETSTGVHYIYKMDKTGTNHQN